MHKLLNLVSKSRARLALFAASLGVLTVGFLPAVASATETPTEEGIKTVATQVSTEGVSIILTVLTALVALIVAVIIIPKAIGFIRRFV